MGFGKNEKGSNYIENYVLFCNVIKKQNINDLLYILNRILQNCYLLPVKTGTFESALQIFTTLNDRGLPLTDSDIFKSEMYKYYEQIGKLDFFNAKWEEIENFASEATTIRKGGSVMNDFFTRYMFYQRAKKGIKSSSLTGLRDFYKQWNLLQTQQTLNDLELIVKFWYNIVIGNKEMFNDKIFCCVKILEQMPDMWYNIITTYYLTNKAEDTNMLDNDKFEYYLNQIIAFMLSFSLVNSGYASKLKTCSFNEMKNIVSKKIMDKNLDLVIMYSHLKK